jgi:hypothetical protein
LWRLLRRCGRAIGWPIAFVDRGERTLREVPGRWRLYEVKDALLVAAA